MVNPDKEKFRKLITETDKECIERFDKIKAISDPEKENKAMDDFMHWRILKHKELFAEFKKWVFSDD